MSVVDYTGVFLIVYKLCASCSRELSHMVDFQQQQKMIEERNKKKREMLGKAIKERFLIFLTNVNLKTVLHVRLTFLQLLVYKLTWKSANPSPSFHASMTINDPCKHFRIFLPVT